VSEPESKRAIEQSPRREGNAHSRYALRRRKKRQITLSIIIILARRSSQRERKRQKFRFAKAHRSYGRERRRIFLGDKKKHSCLLFFDEVRSLTRGTCTRLTLIIKSIVHHSTTFRCIFFRLSLLFYIYRRIRVQSHLHLRMDICVRWAKNCKIFFVHLFE
jgi:hypothetical protein